MELLKEFGWCPKCIGAVKLEHIQKCLDSSYNFYSCKKHCVTLYPLFVGAGLCMVNVYKEMKND